MKKVESQVNFPKLEEEILKYWESEKIFEKTLEKDVPKGDFIFFEGPPTANGKPGLHHVLARSFKDIIPRYKTMQGYGVKRKAGWDTHGLPVELQVEKALGLKNKQEIENIVPGNIRESIIEFNKKCKESVWEYKDLWEKLTERMGYWVDMKNPYITYDNSYIESVWWQLKQISELKNNQNESFLYRGHKVVPYCYRCGTALSSHEVSQGYQTVKDNSVYVKFQVKDEENTFLLVWTTTPWTLPGNVALAVGKDIEYMKLNKIGVNTTDEQITRNKTVPPEAILYVSKEIFLRQAKLHEEPALYTWRVGNLQDFYEILEVVKGGDLIGKEYKPLYDTSDQSVLRVVADDFVNTDSGTGIVHIAPAFGEDDMRIALAQGLPVLVTVDTEGKMNVDGLWDGILVKKKNAQNRYAVDDLIIADLRKSGLLFAEEIYEHEYPFCWRCDTPLIYYAKPSWFIRMSELREELLAGNEKIEWIPENIKEGRFGEWLRGAKDWAISRERYWGTPLPIWNCNSCENQVVVGSQSELKELSGVELEDLHKPYIDDVCWSCSCGGKITRTSEVIDVWFDSGAMPLAQEGYIGEDKLPAFPADYICEAVDQTRGWFYTLHAIATLLGKGGVVPETYAYRNVICVGHVLDAKGKKMSKSKGNVIEPFEMLDIYGADALRWFFFSVNQPGLPKRFDPKGMREVQSRVFRMLWNSYSFFTTYAVIDNWQSSKTNQGEYANTVSKNYFDQWILAELYNLINSVNQKLEAYDVYGGTIEIEQFIDKLSNWYIRLSRDRFWKNENSEDKENAYTTLHQVLVVLTKLMAPFTPFLSEEIYRNLTDKDSVHLAKYPEKSTISFVDDQELLVVLMGIERNLVSIALQQRSDNKIKVRQPLSNIRVNFLELEKVKEEKPELFEEFKNIFMRELNIKEVIFDSTIETVEINTTLTPELKLEGDSREIIRAIQEGRKKALFNVEDRIVLWYAGKENVFVVHREDIAHEVLATTVENGELADAEYTQTADIEGEKFTFWLKRS